MLAFNYILQLLLVLQILLLETYFKLAQLLRVDFEMQVSYFMKTVDV